MFRSSQTLSVYSGKLRSTVSLLTSLNSRLAWNIARLRAFYAYKQVSSILALSISLSQDPGTVNSRLLFVLKFRRTFDFIRNLLE